MHLQIFVLSDLKPKKINNMILRHSFLENDVGGQFFIFYFFEQNAIK